MAYTQRINGNGASPIERIADSKTEIRFGPCLFARVMREVYGPKTPAQLAADMGKNQRTIEFWLAGRVEPDWWPVLQLLQRKMAAEYRRKRPRDLVRPRRITGTHPHRE